MRNRFIGVTSALVGAGLLAVSAAPAALAARGDFGFHDTNGEALTLNNPQDGHCYELRGVGAAMNSTNRGARLYRLPGCDGPFTVLAPHEERPVWFDSVMFVN